MDISNVKDKDTNEEFIIKLLKYLLDSTTSLQSELSQRVRLQIQQTLYMSNMNKDENILNTNTNIEINENTNTSTNSVYSTLLPDILPPIFTSNNDSNSNSNSNGDNDSDDLCMYLYSDIVIWGAIARLLVDLISSYPFKFKLFPAIGEIANIMLLTCIPLRQELGMKNMGRGSDTGALLPNECTADVCILYYII